MFKQSLPQSFLSSSSWIKWLNEYVESMTTDELARSQSFDRMAREFARHSCILVSTADAKDVVDHIDQLIRVHYNCDSKGAVAQMLLSVLIAHLKSFGEQHDRCKVSFVLNHEYFPHLRPDSEFVEALWIACLAVGLELDLLQLMASSGDPNPSAN